MDCYQFKPIGFVKCKEQFKYEQPRQGALQICESTIELETGQNYEQALQDLSGFEYLWLIFVFHQNNGWKPKVNPPRLTDGRKVGLFASRSPYRPNPIGMSCVKLLRVEGLKIVISGSDLLDGTPILDIKPYLCYSDSFPAARQGWLDSETQEEYSIIFQPESEIKFEWLEKRSNLSIRSFVFTQLKLQPISKKRKRLQQIDEQTYILAYRTWRIVFFIEDKQIRILDLYSGYSLDELQNEEDRYADKDTHREFNRSF